MRSSIERLLRDASLVTIALGIAMGWALFQVAEGVGRLVSILLTDYPAAHPTRGRSGSSSRFRGLSAGES